MKKHGTGRVFRRKKHGKELAVWWLEYYADGVQRRESSGSMDYKIACRMLKERLGAVARGDVKPLEVDRLTVGNLLDLLIEDYQDRGVPVPPGQVAAWRARIGHLPARKVERYIIDATVREWRKVGPEWPGRPLDRVRPLSDATCNRYVALLRTAYGIARTKVRGFDYIPSVPHYEEKPTGQYIAPATFQAMLGSLPDDVLKDFFILARSTGIRFGQLRSTELANVDAERWVISWRPDQTKNGEPHIVPLEGDALAAIQRRWAARRLDCRYLFQRDGSGLPKKLRGVWKRACQAAGLRPGRKRGVVFHDFRHTACTDLSAAGVSEGIAMSITGHRSANVFRRYGIRRDDVQRDALRRAEEYRRNLAAEQQPKVAALGDRRSE